MYSWFKNCIKNMENLVYNEQNFFYRRNNGGSQKLYNTVKHKGGHDHRDFGSRSL